MKRKKNIHKQLWHILTIMMIILNIILAIGFIICAYSGYANPLKSAKLAVFGMIFPAFFFANIIFFILWICAHRWKYSLISAFALAVSWGGVLNYFPMNLVPPTIDKAQEKTKFKVMTYNIMGFDDFQNKSDKYNRTLQYILDVDADVVCIQEWDSVLNNKKVGITPEQYKEMHKRYPYHTNDIRDLAFLSKFPIDSVIMITPKNCDFGCDIYQLTIHNVPVSIVNVHLESIGLTSTDKELYYKITSINATDANIKDVKAKAKEVRYKLLSKLAAAFRQRARQAQTITREVERLSGNVILCGDFNDTPNSYSYRTIKKDMNDAFEDCAFWPTITYHDNRFYFRIDQIFYKGNIEAVNVERGNVPCSDHYPLVATFVEKN